LAQVRLRTYSKTLNAMQGEELPVEIVDVFNDAWTQSDLPVSNISVHDQFEQNANSMSQIFINQPVSEENFTFGMYR